MIDMRVTCPYCNNKFVAEEIETIPCPECKETLPLSYEEDEQHNAWAFVDIHPF